MLLKTRVTIDDDGVFVVDPSNQRNEEYPKPEQGDDRLNIDMPAYQRALRMERTRYPVARAAPQVHHGGTGVTLLTKGQSRFKLLLRRLGARSEHAKNTFDK